MSSWNSGYTSDVAYQHTYIRELPPARLAFAALIHRHRAPSVERPFTYCELGAGQGFGVNLIAAANPQAEVWGNDFLPSHVVNARTLAEESGSPNLHFFEDSFEEFLERPGLPVFDYIAVHGIMSWVNAANRKHVVAFLRRHLRPGGLAYVSYNTLPGWAPFMPLRRLLTDYAAADPGATVERIAHAIEFGERLLKLKPGYAEENPNITTNFERGIKGNPLSYLAHDFFNGTWQPFYHCDMAEELNEAKLTFIGSANIRDHVEELYLGPEQQAMLDAAKTSAQRETLRDWFLNQHFRRDLYIKGPVPMSVPEVNAAWQRFRFALNLPASKIDRKIIGPIKTMELSPEIFEPLFEALTEAPQTLPELLARPALAAIGGPHVRQSLNLLYAVGLLEAGPAEPPAAPRTAAFNDAVLRRAATMAEMQALASPVTGAGLKVNRQGMLWLLARRSGAPDPVAFSLNVMRALGINQFRGEERVEGEAENYALLRERMEDFATNQLPILRQLQMV